MEEPSLSLSSSLSPSSSSSNEASLLKRCEICLFDQPISSFCFTCSSHSFCQGCLSSYFNLQITEGKVSPLSCPSFNCSQDVDDQLVYFLADSMLWERYQKFTFERGIEQMNDVFFCPKADCSAPIWASLRKKEGTCFQCRGRYCMNCKEKAHYGSCSLLEMKASKEDKDWFQQQAKQCPRCFVYIEKNGGCDHMKCQRCFVDFYWSKTSSFLVSPVSFSKKTIQKWKHGPSVYYSEDVKITPARPKKDCPPEPQKNPPPTKKCPSCNQKIEKGNKNNLMSCSHCHARFCFSCLSFLRKGTCHFGPSGNCLRRVDLSFDDDDDDDDDD